ADPAPKSRPPYRRAPAGQVRPAQRQPRHSGALPTFLDLLRRSVDIAPNVEALQDSSPRSLAQGGVHGLAQPLRSQLATGRGKCASIDINSGASHIHQYSASHSASSRYAVPHSRLAQPPSHSRMRDELASDERSPWSRIASALFAIASIAVQASLPPTLTRCPPAAKISPIERSRW